MTEKFRRVLAVLVLCGLLLTALPRPAAAASVRFQDVPPDHWAAESIARAVSAGLIRGETATAFGLGHKMTRAAFTVVLCRFFGWKLQTPAVGSFTDNRDPAAWYYGAVETAYAHGAVTRQSSEFRPGDAITREEMAVMLVRALGGSAIAGLDQGLSCPFTDVHSDAGYLTMAYYLGISGGTSANTFSPDREATREQAVAMLMRVYDRCHGKAPERIGIAPSVEGLADLSGFGAVAVPAGRLVYNGTLHLTASMEDADAEALRAAAAAAGAKTLLEVTGDAPVLAGSADDAVQEVAAEVSQDAYDGVLLDIPKLTGRQRDRYTQLAAALRSALGDKLLYVTAEAPASDGTAYGGYDYAALGKQADRLILRVQPYEKETNGFPTAPPEPLEEVYFALASLKGRVDASGLALWLTTTGTAFHTGAGSGSVTASEIKDLLLAGGTETYCSDRYGSAYLSRTVNGTRTVVWYNDGNAAAARVRLCAFFGVGSICLSDLSSVADYGGGSVLDGLRG
jgi:hypothetical protein